MAGLASLEIRWPKLKRNVSADRKRDWSSEVHTSQLLTVGRKIQDAVVHFFADNGV